MSGYPGHLCQVTTVWCAAFCMTLQVEGASASPVRPCPPLLSVVRLHPESVTSARGCSFWPLLWSVQNLPVFCDYGSTDGLHGKMSLFISKQEEVLVLFITGA